MNITRQVLSGAIAVSGSLSNSLSLAYFVSEESKGLGSRLLILLNTFDLGTCVAACACVLSLLPDDSLLLNIFRFLFRTFVQCTAFTTLLLSITRTVCMWAPFYRLNLPALVTGTILVLLGMTSAQLTGFLTGCLHPETAYLESVNSVLLVVETILMTVIFLTVILCNGLSIIRLATVEGESLAEINRRATVTVSILSACFCLFNATFILNLFLYQTEDYSLPEPVRWFSFWVAIPLNSTLNPCIYILRKQPMRAFIARGWARLTRRPDGGRLGVPIRLTEASKSIACSNIGHSDHM